MGFPFLSSSTCLNSFMVYYISITNFLRFIDLNLFAESLTAELNGEITFRVFVAQIKGLNRRTEKGDCMFGIDFMYVCVCVFEI